MKQTTGKGALRAWVVPATLVMSACLTGCEGQTDLEMALNDLAVEAARSALEFVLEFARSALAALVL